MVSSARTEEVLKVIVANPAMIKAYKAGVPGNGRPFPQGSMIVKLQWKPKKSTEAPFDVDVPDVFKQVFVMEKDSKRFPKTGGWGYAVFNYDAASGKFTADPNALEGCEPSCPVLLQRICSTLALHTSAVLSSYHHRYQCGCWTRFFMHHEVSHKGGKHGNHEAHLSVPTREHGMRRART